MHPDERRLVARAAGILGKPDFSFLAGATRLARLIHNAAQSAGACGLSLRDSDSKPLGTIPELWYIQPISSLGEVLERDGAGERHE